jgi:transposase
MAAGVVSFIAHYLTLYSCYASIIAYLARFFCLSPVSKILGVSNFFIGYWKKQFKTKGIAGIKLGHKGSKGYLRTLQNTEVIEWLKNKKSWDLDELFTYLEQELGVIYKSK